MSTKQLGNDWRNASVSSGTMRSEDLIPRLEAVLQESGIDLEDNWERPTIVTAFLEYPEDVSDQGMEKVEYYVEALFDALDEIAPEGCYFGANEGDGCDYGFWTSEAE